MKNMTTLEITYSGSGDLLSIWGNGKGLYKGSAQIVTMDPNCSSFYNADGKCVGIYWFDAGRIALPVLERDDLSEVKKYPELLVDYCRESDTLLFGNRNPVIRSEEIVPGLTAHLGPDGLAQRFTLENVSDVLLYRFHNPNWS